MKPENEEKLFGRFAAFFERKNLLDHGIDCGDGWYPIIFQLCEQIELVLKTNPESYSVGPLLVDQVKQKYGGLRFYVTWETDEISKLIAKAEELSFKTCETCGNPGTLRGRGWLETTCDLHETNREGM